MTTTNSGEIRCFYLNSVEGVSIRDALACKVTPEIGKISNVVPSGAQRKLRCSPTVHRDHSVHRRHSLACHRHLHCILKVFASGAGRVLFQPVGGFLDGFEELSNMLVFFIERPIGLTHGFFVLFINLPP